MKQLYRSIVMALDWKETSQWWYGRITTRTGKRKLINLGVKIEGRRPRSIVDQGDAAFERSRGKAIREHDRILSEIQNKQNLEELTQRVIELKTGSRVEAVKLEDLPDTWEQLPRPRATVPRYSNMVRSRLLRFAMFIQNNSPSVEDLDMVTREHARAFMDAEDARGISPKTWNDTLKTLRSAFRHMAPDSDAYRKYLATCPAKASETVFRKPFTPDELKVILDAAKDDDFARPLIVTALCTAMRRGDCCCLKWKNVDLEQRFITVKTTKTRQTVTIPIFPALHKELNQLRGNGSKYVFPEAATMYRRNPDGITLRVRHVLAQAGFVDGETLDRVKESNGLPVLPRNELKEQALAAIKRASFGEKKKARMRRVFDLYLKGKTIPEIADETGFSKGSVSGHLNEVEQMTGAIVIRRGAAMELPAVLRGEIHEKRENGKRRASVRDFHSFRVTWVTLALSAGVPLEIVQKVTGHKTIEIVLKHYFQPGREDFRKALEAALPKLLTSGRE